MIRTTMELYYNMSSSLSTSLTHKAVLLQHDNMMERVTENIVEDSHLIYYTCRSFLFH